MLTLVPRADPFAGFCWNGQPRADWPAWVAASCHVVTIDGIECLRHERRSGAQIVYPGEALVKHPDRREPEFYTVDEFARAFEPRR